MDFPQFENEDSSFTLQQIRLSICIMDVPKKYCGKFSWKIRLPVMSVKDSLLDSWLAPVKLIRDRDTDVYLQIEYLLVRSRKKFCIFDNWISFLQLVKHEKPEGVHLQTYPPPLA